MPKCVRVCVRQCMCVRACVRARVCVCAYVCVSTKYTRVSTDLIVAYRRFVICVKNMDRQNRRMS